MLGSPACRTAVVSWTTNAGTPRAAADVGSLTTTAAAPFPTASARKA